MDFRAHFFSVLDWYDEILICTDEKEFITFCKCYLENYFIEVDRRSGDVIKTSILGDSLLMEALNYKLEFKVVMFKVYFIKHLNDEREQLGYYNLDAGKNHKLMNKEIKLFHPSYLRLLVEEAFADFRKVSEKINNNSYFV